MTTVRAILEAIILFFQNVPELIKRAQNARLKDTIKEAEDDFKKNNSTDKYEQLFK